MDRYYEDFFPFVDISCVGERVWRGAVVRVGPVAGFGEHQVDAAVDREVG